MQKIVHTLDSYTKVILTLIAFLLLILCLKQTEQVEAFQRYTNVPEPL